MTWWPRQGRHRAAPKPALGRGKHPTVPQYLPSCRAATPAASGDSDATARGQPSPRRGDSPAHPVPSSISRTPQKWLRLGLLRQGCVFQRKTAQKTKPRRKAPEGAIPNASDSFINDGPGIRYSRRVELFTPLAGRRHVPGKPAREQTELCSISRPPPQALARCSWVGFGLREQEKTRDLQSCKQPHSTLPSSAAAPRGAEGGRSPLHAQPQHERRYRRARGSPQNLAASPTLPVPATQMGHSERDLAEPCAPAHPPPAPGRCPFHPGHIPWALRHTPAPEG